MRRRAGGISFGRSAAGSLFLSFTGGYLMAIKLLSREELDELGRILGIEIPQVLELLKIEIDEEGLVKYELHGFGEN
jgi:hypothetical protein